MYSPRFTITNKVLKNIGIIEACREVIDHAPLLPYYEKKFRDEALVRTVHHGTHIEGNELNLSQAERVLAGEEVVARERDVQEVINYRKVMDFIAQLEVKSSQPKAGPPLAPIQSGLAEKFKVGEDLIKEIHRITVQKILVDDQAGAYRQTQVVVRNSRSLEVSFKPPAKEEVPVKIKDLIMFINDSSGQDVHAVLKSGIVHYELARIHPFVDGNGRVARALSTLILLSEGYDIRRFFSLEEYFDKEAVRYYEALQSVEKRGGDLTEWLEYFTQGLAIELSKIKERVEKISIDGKLREKLGGKPLLLSDRQLKIVEYIQETGYLQNKAFKTVFPMVSEDTILNELKALLKEGILKKKGITKAAKYMMG